MRYADEHFAGTARSRVAASCCTGDAYILADPNRCPRDLRPAFGIEDSRADELSTAAYGYRLGTVRYYRGRGRMRALAWLRNSYATTLEWSTRCSSLQVALWLLCASEVLPIVELECQTHFHPVRYRRAIV